MLRLSILLLALSAAFSQDPTAALARRIADAQRRLPWFWSPPIEGLADLPYTYEMKESKDRPVSTLHLERVPLDAGSYYRCLAQNGASPCAAEIVAALEKDSHWATTASAEAKAAGQAARQARQRRRKAFWTDFSNALTFERSGPNQLRFRPNRKYRPPADAALLAKIQGDLWFDPATFVITRMQYTMVGSEPEILSRMAKGSTFSITLASLADQHYLPEKVALKRVLPKGGVENSTLEFVNYRRFTTDSTVQFLERDK